MTVENAATRRSQEYKASIVSELFDNVLAFTFSASITLLYNSLFSPGCGFITIWTSVMFLNALKTLLMNISRIGHP